MMRIDKDALTCDFAETYHIYDIRTLPLRMVGVLAVGLRDNSRIRMKMADMNVDLQTILLAGILDKLSFLCWSKTSDAYKGLNKPKSVTEFLLGKEPQGDVKSYEGGDAFLKAREELIKAINKNKGVV